MLKRKYYYLVAGLPDLFFDENKPGFNALLFREELESQLIPADLERIRLLFFPEDNNNLLNLFFDRNLPFRPNGNFSREFMENQIELPKRLPPYMTTFINWANNLELKEYSVEAETKLNTLFYEYVLQEKNEFISDWFRFELNVKNVLTAFHCKQFNYEPEKQLVETSFNKQQYNTLIGKRLTPEFFEDELPFAEQIFRVAGSDLTMIEKEKAIDKIKWDYLDEFTFFHYFTIEKIVSFTLKIGIIERWMKLDPETGTSLLHKLIDELKTSYKFPAEFSV